MKRLIYSILIVLMASSTVVADHDQSTEQARQALKTLLDEFMRGASSNDRASHERFWADDLIYTSSSGERFGKQHILDGLAAAADSSEPTAQYRATEVNIRLLSDSIAVITFVLVADLPDQTRQHYLNTSLFTRHNDNWRASVWQATKSSEHADMPTSAAQQD